MNIDELGDDEKAVFLMVGSDDKILLSEDDDTWNIPYFKFDSSKFSLGKVFNVFMDDYFGLSEDEYNKEIICRFSICSNRMIAVDVSLKKKISLKDVDLEVITKKIDEVISFIEDQEGVDSAVIESFVLDKYLSYHGRTNTEVDEIESVYLKVGADDNIRRKKGNIIVDMDNFDNVDFGDADEELRKKIKKKEEKLDNLKSEVRDKLSKVKKAVESKDKTINKLRSELKSKNKRLQEVKISVDEGTKNNDSEESKMIVKDDEDIDLEGFDEF